VSKKKTIEEFIAQANIIHNNIYNYTKSKYISVSSKIEIICNIHGSFWQTPRDHLYSAARCPYCFGTPKKSIEEFIAKANIIHNNKYNYSKAIYLSNKNNIEIICNIHGSFLQNTKHHLNGSGCKKCAGLFLDLECFINKANLVHNHKYEYTNVIYFNSTTKIEIICKNHGSWFQTPNVHLTGHGCPKCSHLVSKQETEWLDSLNISLENRNIHLPKLGRKRVDGYDPKTNTVYEFYGNYWHGNPILYNHNDFNHKSKKTFGELYLKTINREMCIKNAGYNIIHIWELDYLKLINE